MIVDLDQKYTNGVTAPRTLRDLIKSLDESSVWKGFESPLDYLNYHVEKGNLAPVK